MYNRKFVVLGDLIADLYYNGTKLIGIDGGSSRYNVIANLASMKCNTALIGGCGNDKIGNIVLERYRKLGIDISGVIYKNKPTRAYHLIVDQAMLPKITYECSKISPSNYKSTWYDDSLQDIKYCRSQVTKNDIVVLDKLDEFSLDIINNFECYKALDIGHSKRIEKLSDSQIIALKEKISLLQLNERVIPYLMQRYGYSNILDIYKLFQPKLMIVTRGRKGADFIFENRKIQKRIRSSTEELDPTGAGDAFFSVFIKEYFNSSIEKIDDEFINETFSKALTLTGNVVKYVGARGHIYARTFDKIVSNKEKEEIKEL